MKDNWLIFWVLAIGGVVTITSLICDTFQKSPDQPIRIEIDWEFHGGRDR
jgi:hypothetical protein